MVRLLTNKDSNFSIICLFLGLCNLNDIFMRKAFLFVILLASCTLAFSQTFVSTTPSNKKVVIEEFTGINCGWCPQGHLFVNDIMNDHPDQVFAINIHAGGYAANTYTTADGERIRSNWNVTSFPSGMVNRTKFTTSATPVYGREKFSPYTNQALAQRACANIAARCTINSATRIMTVNVELFYTADSQVDTNYLSVALLQDNILGPQSGMGLNPTQIVDDQYNHMHMFRGFVNGGTWGDTIATTDSGSFVYKTYTYTIPATISNVPVRLYDLSVIAFVAEGKDNIINVCKADISYVNGTPTLTKMAMREAENCDVEFPTYVSVFNMGYDTIRSLEIRYGTNVRGGYTITRSGLNIGYLERDTVHLPVMTGLFSSLAIYTGYAKIIGVNGVTVDYDSITCSLKKVKKNTSGDTLTFELTTDRYGSETTFKFMHIDRSVVDSGGPYANASATHAIKLAVPHDGCYILEVYDDSGDGINGGYGNGNFSLSDNTGLLFTNDGRFGAKAQYFLNCRGTSNDIDATSAIDFAIYPNPVGNTLNIYCDQKVSKIEVFDMQGKTITVADNSTAVNVSSFCTGTYVVRITTDEGVAVRTFVKE